MRTIRPAGTSERQLIDVAVQRLRTARDALRAAGAPRAAAATRRALKSAEGAQRHVRHRLARAKGRQERSATQAEVETTIRGMDRAMGARGPQEAGSHEASRAGRRARRGA